MVMEGGAVGAAAVGFARKRPRRQRVRREPIDLEQIAAEFADASAPAEPTRPNEREIMLALEAEVERLHAARALAAATVEVEPEVEDEETPMLSPASDVGLPLDQVRAWLDQVQDDLAKVDARVEYLQHEQTRLQEQHRLVAELISSSNPV
jgi:hypothetical protein